MRIYAHYGGARRQAEGSIQYRGTEASETGGFRRGEGSSKPNWVGWQEGNTVVLGRSESSVLRRVNVSTPEAPGGGDYRE